MPAENCVCAVSLHGNRKLLRPFKKKKYIIIMAHRDDTQPRCRNPGALVLAGGVVSYPRKSFLSVPFLPITYENTLYVSPLLHFYACEASLQSPAHGYYSFDTRANGLLIISAPNSSSSHL